MKKITNYMSKHHPTPYLCLIFVIICFSAIACVKERPNPIFTPIVYEEEPINVVSAPTDNRIITHSFGNVEWGYLKSPSGACYEIPFSSTHGNLGMEKVSPSFCKGMP